MRCSDSWRRLLSAGIRFRYRELLMRAGKYFRKVTKNRTEKVEPIIPEPMDAKVIGDYQLRFLFENLIDEALAVREERAEIRLQARKDTNISVSFLRIPDAIEECDGAEPVVLSNANKYDFRRKRSWGNGISDSKQIIRDHDEIAGRRGCRVCRTGRRKLRFTSPSRADRKEDT